MNVMTAYKWRITGKDVVVTILDDGIEKDHPDLSRNYVCLDNRTVLSAQQTHTHTHVEIYPVWSNYYCVPFTFVLLLLLVLEKGIKSM